MLANYWPRLLGIPALRGGVTQLMAATAANRSFRNMIFARRLGCGNRRQLGVAIVNNHIRAIAAVAALKITLVPKVILGKFRHGWIEIRIPAVWVARKIGHAVGKRPIAAG